jgi:hypothetical protein
MEPRNLFCLRKLNKKPCVKVVAYGLCFDTRWKLSWVNLPNYAPCSHSLAMWFIEGCFATTQAKKMVLVSDWVPHTYVIYPAFSLWYYCSLLSLIFFLDMRKALSQDVDKKSIIPLKRPITPDELEYDWCWISNDMCRVLFNLDDFCTRSLVVSSVV